MRQKLITLDPTSWDLAAQKPNFSQWVRDQLRSERNKTSHEKIYCRYCGHHWPRKAFYDHICIPGWKLEEDE